MILTRRKIFWRTQRAQRTRKNTHKLWIKKSLTEQMHFQMSLELQEISDVTKAAWKRVPNSRGSKMKWAFTGCLQVNRGNFEQFFRRWVKNTWWLINVLNRRQIIGCFSRGYSGYLSVIKVTIICQERSGPDFQWESQNRFSQWFL